LEGCEDRVLLSVVNWVGGSGDWNTASNWSTGEVPGLTDDVAITTAGIKVTHATTAYDQVQSIQLANGAGIALELSSGTLGAVNATFNNNNVSVQGNATLMIHAAASSSGHFEIVASDATVSGEGTLTNSGDSLWTAGVMDADWTIAKGATLTVSGSEN